MLAVVQPMSQPPQGLPIKVIFTGTSNASGA
jgi:hypothetical protein